MASFKQVTLKDPVTGEYLSPRVYGALEYEVVEDGEVTPPYDMNADTLQGHPASDFLLKSEYTPVDAIPTGVICMWSGESTAIPSGWHLCDGEEGTPDLRDRFIVGAGSTYKVKDTGGEATHKLTTNEMPSHNHGFTGTSHSHTGSLSNATAASNGNHTHSISGSSSGGYIMFGPSENGSNGPEMTIVNGPYLSNRADAAYFNGGGELIRAQTDTTSYYAQIPVQGSNGNSLNIQSSGVHTHSVTGNVTVNSATAGGTVGNTGDGQAHENRPPYYALCFIMKL